MQTQSVRAPAGGEFSPATDRFYEGGQFFPTSGLSQYSKRRAKSLAEKNFNLNWSRITFCPRFPRVFRINFSGSLRRIFVTAKECNTEAELRAMAELMIAERAKLYTSKGWMPHPTEIVVEP